MFVKICGITRLTDALHAVKAGATALGFVFWPHSPRYVTPERAAEIIGELPSTILTVGVFVNEPVNSIRDVVGKSRITTVQLHGDEPPAYADGLGWPIIRIGERGGRRRSACSAWPAETVFLLDAIDPVRRGGTGGHVDWTRAAGIARDRRIVLAGGLTPGNVGAGDRGRAAVRRGRVVRCGAVARSQGFRQGGPVRGQRTECL